MKRYNNLRRLMLRVALPALAGLLAFGACTEVDDTLGVEFIPENQEMKAGFKCLDRRTAAGRRYFETRLFQSDSIRSVNLTNGHIGKFRNDTFGLRNAGFFSQYVSYYQVDSGYFGYRPIFDSMQLLLSISDYRGDTTAVQHFAIYEVVDNSFLTGSKDTAFYTSFDPTPYLAAEPLFTFDFPDGKTTGPATTAITLTPTPRGLDFVERLLLLKGDVKGDYDLYDDDEKWVNKFKGVYIRPTDDSAPGALFSTTLSSTGLALYGRNRSEEDPTIVKDTVGAVYYFYDNYATKGNVSITTVEHDYSSALLDIEAASEKNSARPTTRTCYVEGMGGIVTEIRFTEDFFAAIEQILDDEFIASGERFQTLAINQAVLSIYLEQGDYEWPAIDPGAITPWLDYYTKRLGLYTDYKKKSAIPDYYYQYEQQYDYTLAYGGYLNRSRGCYTMDISSYLQSVWNNYLEEERKAAAEGRKVNMDNVAASTIYLAPAADEYFSYTFSSAQGMEDEANHASMRVDLTYTLIK